MVLWDVNLNITIVSSHFDDVAQLPEPSYIRYCPGKYWTTGTVDSGTVELTTFVLKQTISSEIWLIRRYVAVTGTKLCLLRVP